ncbi:MAG: hypothetical protein Q8K12_02765 [Thiobacillus sp.]|nr:hypothetical protein [Thiobacillus sp.]
MASIEENNEDWRELRSRVDSIANAVFLVAGGALSLSITVILGNKTATYITKEVISLTVQAWYFLLAAVVLFLLLKTHLVLQAFLLQFKPDFVNRHLVTLNLVGWMLGALGFASFAWGVFAMVQSAVVAVRI